MAIFRRVAPLIGYLYLTFVKWTTRVEWIHLDYVEPLDRGGRNYIYAFWHNRQALFCFTHGNRNAAVLVSRSKDGDIVSKVMAYSGIGTIRGSSSRGAVEATVQMIEAASKGVHVGVSPDGPKGPVYQVKPGVLYVAQKTGFPIIPITNATGRKLVLKKSWDRYQIPLPFARACIVHGAPIFVAEKDDLARKAAELEKALVQITSEADRRVGGL